MNKLFLLLSVFLLVPSQSLASVQEEFKPLGLRRSQSTHGLADLLTPAELKSVELHSLYECLNREVPLANVDAPQKQEDFDNLCTIDLELYEIERWLNSREHIPERQFLIQKRRLNCISRMIRDISILAKARVQLLMACHSYDDKAFSYVAALVTALDSSLDKLLSLRALNREKLTGPKLVQATPPEFVTPSRNGCAATKKLPSEFII